MTLCNSPNYSIPHCSKGPSQEDSGSSHPTAQVHLGYVLVLEGCSGSFSWLAFELRSDCTEQPYCFACPLGVQEPAANNT